MSENWSFLGNVADWYDRQTNHILVLRDRALQAVDPRGLSGRNSLLSPVGLWAAWGTGLVRMSQGFVDTLRIGNGIRQGGWGYAEDAMRALNVVDGAGFVLGRVGRVLKMVIQPSGSAVCTWVSVFNALERTNNQIFVSLRDLMSRIRTTEANINSAGGTHLHIFREIIDTLRLFRIEVEELRIAVGQLGWEQLMSHALIRRRGVFIVAFSYAGQAANAVRSRAAAAHHVIATYSREYGLIFQDTNGRIYAGVQALRQAYPEATVMREFPIIFIRDSAAVTSAPMISTATRAARAAESAGAGGGGGGSVLDNLVLPSVPIVSDGAPPPRE